jgi:hypothetical protein
MVTVILAPPATPMATLVFPWIGKRHVCCAKGGNHAAQQKRLSHTHDDLGLRRPARRHITKSNAANMNGFGRGREKLRRASGQFGLA